MAPTQAVGRKKKAGNVKMLDFSFHNDAATTKPLRFFNVVVFLTVVFHKFSSESVAFNVFPCERCHC